MRRKKEEKEKKRSKEITMKKIMEKVSKYF